MIYQNILITNLEDGVTTFMMTLDLEMRKDILLNQRRSQRRMVEENMLF